jgi:hypothetical protein
MVGWWVRIFDWGGGKYFYLYSFKSCFEKNRFVGWRFYNPLKMRLRLRCDVEPTFFEVSVPDNLI